MPTIDNLIETGALQRLDACLDPHQQPLRCIYLRPEARKWLEEMLPTQTRSSLGNALSPSEQVDALVEAFVSGRSLNFG